MKVYLVIVLLYLLVLHVKAGLYDLSCMPGYSSFTVTTFQQYDVTNDSFHIYSHDGYRFGYKYGSGYYRRCIYIWTNMTDHIIKLEEKDFQIENSIDCDADSLTIYYTSFEDADQLNHEGIWCSNKGPGTKYSSANHMFLYFKTDDDIGLRGFEFVVSGIHKDDVPGLGLSAGAIVGIVFGVLALVIVIIVVIVCLVKKKNKQNPTPTNQNAVGPSSTTTTTATTSQRNHSRVRKKRSKPPNDLGNNICPRPLPLPCTQSTEFQARALPPLPPIKQQSDLYLRSESPPSYDSLYK